MTTTEMTSDTFAIGGELTVRRLGFGALRLTGWDPMGPAEWAAAAGVVRRAVELGVNFLDTADSYDRGSNEELLAEALYPYPDGLVIATKAGQARPSRGEWVPMGRPEYLRQQCELSLRRLRLDRIDLFYLHRVDPLVPFEDQLGALRRLQEDGKIRHIGLSEVTVEQLAYARERVEVAAVQNLYNLADRRHERVLEYCERHRIAFVPWLPVANGRGFGPAATRVAAELGTTPIQVGLAWLLHRSPVMTPIPGTSSLTHLEENVAAAGVRLTATQYTALAG
jgi:aryl-alcohol dehydrogenase-like predicted oxidoreductase